MAATPEPIAIVGIGCRLAGSINDPAQFWTFLTEGRSDVREVPEERWEPYLRRDPRNAAVLKETTRWGTFLDDLPGFDAEFFGVSPREAELMDPQQRLALEVSWEALEHAGVQPRTLAGSDTAVLMGVNSDDYGKLIMEDLPGIEAWTGIGTSLCGIANRVSHLLDLRGPSVALDAACAASLVAVHQACQMLRSGETSLALAGGVSALIGPGLTRVLDEAGATAPDGRCKTFDASADGYGRGEGAAVVVLKRLADAERDGDRILALVRGGAIAQDGRTVGIMSPNGDAQADMFARACESAGVPPASVDFVEAHGTGTPTGDPTEVRALASVYGVDRPADAPCRIGSVKPNVGHLEGGAGVVGLVKATLALHHEAIPPTAGVKTLTPAVDWENSGLRVPTVLEPWERTDGAPRRAAVCSYGYGGTIAHILLEEAPAVATQPAAEVLASTVVPISARSSTRLRTQARALADHLRAGEDGLDRVAATAWTRRTHESTRAAVVADDIDSLVSGLDALANEEPDPLVVTGSALATEGAVWVFSGHGSHWAGMGQQLLEREPAFSAVIDAIDPVFREELGFCARDALRTGELGGTDRVQALTFAMQVGLAAVLRERGVTPAAVIGHSVGEVAACVTAGVFDLKVGAAVACYRARGFQSVMGNGAMALVRLPFDEAERRLEGHRNVVAAISASPASTVVSGTVSAVEQICQIWTDEGVMIRRVNTDVAFHSPAMDALTAELGRLTGELPQPRPAEIRLYTTALTDPRSSAPRDQNYWVANLRDRVRFAEAVTAAAEDGHRLFLEVSAHPVVAHSIVETLTHAGIDEHAVLPVLRRDRPELQSVATAVGALYCNGAPVNHGIGASAPWADSLPVTQWHHRRFWRTPTPPPGGRGVHDVDTHNLLGGRMDVTGAVASTVWQTRLDMDNRPYPGNHPVQNTEIVPAAVILNTFLGAVANLNTRSDRSGTDLVDVRLRTPVAPSRARDVQVVLQDRGLTLSTRLVDDDDPNDDGGWLTHSSAVAAADDDIEDLLGQVVDEAAAQQRCAEILPPNHVVDTLATLGVAAMGFGWEILDLRRGAAPAATSGGGDGELIARVAADGDRSEPTTWASLLDAATSAASTIFDGPPRLRMPARIERVQVYGRPPAVAVLHVRRRPGTTTTDVLIAEESGAVRASLTGMSFEELENPAGSDLSRMLHHVTWHSVPWQRDARPSAVFVVGGDAENQRFVTRDLAAADVPYATYGEAGEIDTAAAELDRDAVVLVLPRMHDTPQQSVEVVMQTLRHLLDGGAKSRVWVLTQRVHEGGNVVHAPLWGLARVAAAEHPKIFGGVLDIDDAKLPVGALASLRGHPVVVMRDGEAQSARLAFAGRGTGAPMQCSPGGTYLITGGTGVLGLRMAQRLADIGARRIVLLSRSGMLDRAEWRDAAESELIRTVAALEERGVSVHIMPLDIAAPDAAEALRVALRYLPPVRGVIHAAGVEAGALLVNTTTVDFEKAMHPKVDGTLTLHEVFPPEQLDWMVLFSSCGYLAGFPGQGAYACANSFLDVMARHRRRLGDRTVSIAWTAWRGLGMGSTSGFVAAQLDALGMGTIGADEAIHALDLAMRDNQPNVVVLPVLPGATSVPMLADVAPLEDEGSAPENSALGSFVGDDGEPDLQRVAECVVAAVSAQLGLPQNDVDTALPLVEIGVDSIMTVGLLRQLEKQTGLSLPPTLLWEYPTAAAVSERITEMLGAPDFLAERSEVPVS